MCKCTVKSIPSVLRRPLFCVAVFVFVLAWLLPQMNHGIFIGDTGYNLYEAQQAFHFFGRPSPHLWLTSYIGGAWLALFPSEGVFYWYALGGAVICALTYVAAGLIIREIFSVPYVRLFVVLAISAVLQLHLLHDFSINYYSLPFGVAEIALLLYLKSRNAVQPRAQLLYLIGSGMVFSVLPALRMPAICLVYTPVAYELALSVCGKGVKWKSVFIYIATTVVCMGCLYLLYCAWHNAFPEVAFAGDANVEGHSKRFILFSTLTTFFRCFWGGVFMVVALLLIRRMAFAKYVWRWLLFIAAAIYILYCGWCSFCSGEHDSVQLAFSHMYVLQVAMPFLLLILAILPARWGIRQIAPENIRARDNFEFRLTLVMIACFGIFYPFGTDTGSLKILYCIPLVSPLLLIILRDYIGWKTSCYRVCVFFMLLLSLAALPGTVDTHAPAARSRLMTTTPYRIEALRGMYETPQRVASHEKLVHAIQQYTAPQEEVLFIGHVYELLPAAKVRSWMHPQYRIPFFASSDIDTYMRNKNLPEVAILIRGDYYDSKIATWESEFLPKYYQKVYFTDCAPALCDGEQAPLHEFSIWKRKKD